MINADDVKNVVAQIGGYSSDELEQYSTIIDCSTSTVFESLREGSDPADSRVIMLCATMANYSIALIKNGASAVTSFTAGDVSISETSSTVQNALSLLNNERLNCTSLINDDSFAFLGV